MLEEDNYLREREKKGEKKREEEGGGGEEVRLGRVRPTFKPRVRDPSEEANPLIPHSFVEDLWL